MRRISLVLSLGLLLILPLAAPSAAGPWKVEFWQSGVPMTEVQAGTEFQIRGEGFHAAVLPVKVCIFDRQCQLADVDREGKFVVNRTITTSGMYEIWVMQAKDMHISEWKVRTKGPLTVKN